MFRALMLTAPPRLPVLQPLHLGQRLPCHVHQLRIAPRASPGLLVALILGVSSGVAANPDARTKIQSPEVVLPRSTSLGDLAERDSADAMDHRPSGASSPRRNEVVPARRGSLPAPSELTLSELGRSSVRLNWMDNSTTEHGVDVERGVPLWDRGGINYHWQHAFNVEERIDSRIRSTGWRTDLDDQLATGTEYCWRIRAYRSTLFSAYSPAVCAVTKP